MIKVGLTGGIGTGKSIVAKAFAELGVPIYSADAEAKKAYGHPEILNSIKDTFGEKVFENGVLSFKELAHMVFTDKTKLQLLDSIIHPFVMRDFEKWTRNFITAPYIIMESAILFETSFHRLFDKIITVSAPVELCIERVMKRDGASREHVIQRMSSQLPDEQKTIKADFVIKNDGKSLLLPQILVVHEQLLKMPGI